MCIERFLNLIHRKLTHRIGIRHTVFLFNMTFKQINICMNETDQTYTDLLSDILL